VSEFNDVLVEFPGISGLQKMVEAHHTPHGQRLIVEKEILNSHSNLSIEK
jgi:hypothetical protein